jgi:plasmid stabilization system protein ParE
VAQVVWASSAQRHLNQIAEYIAERSPANAERVVRRVIDAAEQLAMFPHVGQAVAESIDSEDRHVLCRPFKIIYRINEEDDVTIIAVVHGARDLRFGQPPGPEDLTFEDE